MERTLITIFQLDSFKATKNVAKHGRYNTRKTQAIIACFTER